MDNPAIVADAVLVAALTLGGLFYGTWDRLRASRAGQRWAPAEPDWRHNTRLRSDRHAVPFPAERQTRLPGVSSGAAFARRALGRCQEHR